MARKETVAPASSQNTARTLYLKTNVDTHFVMRVAEDDTVAQLKQKISVNHLCCFPETGEITVCSLKVRHKGCFYHLMDTMILKLVFEAESRRGWHLHVDLEVVPQVPAALLLGGISGRNLAGVPPKEMVDGERTKLRKRHKAEVVEFSKPLDPLHVVSTEVVTRKAQLHANGEGVELLKPVDSPVVVKTGAFLKKRRKMSKKDIDADSMAQLHANDADDASKFDADVHTVGIHNISSQPESRQYLEVCCGGDHVGSVGNYMMEWEKVLVQNDDAKIISETTDALLKTKDLDVFANSVDATGDIAQVPSDTGKKKVKKIKIFDAKNTVSAAQLKNVETAGDTLVVQGHLGVEHQNGDTILVETEGVNALKVECLNTPAGIFVNNSYQGTGHEDTSPNNAKIIRDQETTEKIDVKAKLKSVNPHPSTSNTVTDQGMKQQVEAQDPSDMRKKKAKKTKNPKAKSNISTSPVEHVEGAGDAIVVQNHPSVERGESDIIFSDTEGVKVSNLERLNTPVEGTVNADFQGSGHEDHIVPNYDNKKHKPRSYTCIRRNIYISKKGQKRSKEDGIFCRCDSSVGSSVCGGDCDCGMLMSCCSLGCGCGTSCLNIPFHRRPIKKMKVVKTKKCGSGMLADEDIQKGEFIIEYVGEVIDDKTCEERLWEMKHHGETNFYLCEISRDMVIDARYKGNKSRYINHSCLPNTQMQKWTNGGETRLGIFAILDIKKGEHVTFDYQYVQFGADQDCHCGTSVCRGKLGAKASKQA